MIERPTTHPAQPIRPCAPAPMWWGAMPVLLVVTLLVAEEALGPVADIAWMCLVTVALFLG